MARLIALLLLLTLILSACGASTASREDVDTAEQQNVVTVYKPPT